MTLSVIICTRNRAHTLGECLASVVAALQACGDGMEIVVVDNGSSDDTAARLADFTASCPLPVQVIREPQPGLSRARNAGIRAAKGHLLAFTDDDCRPAPDCFQVMLRHAASDTAPVLRGGRVELGDPTDQPYGILIRTEAESWQKDTITASGRNLGCALIGASMMAPRTLFDTVGLFDERFGAGGRFGGAEDIDLIYRSYDAGFRIDYVPEAVIHHFHGRKTLAAIRTLVRSYDFGDGALYAKHMFRSPMLLKPLWWDFKKALREPVGGPLCRPDLGLSHWYRLWGVIRGMLAYFFYLTGSQRRQISPADSGKTASAISTPPATPAARQPSPRCQPDEDEKMAKKLCVGTGWYSTKEPVDYVTHGDQSIRGAGKFRELWWHCLTKTLAPDYLVLVDSASPIKPNDAQLYTCPVHLIELNLNPGHSQNTPHHYCGWSASVIMSLEYAYLTGADMYVYLEQDVLINAPDLKAEMESSFSSSPYIFGNGAGTPQILQQSLFAIERRGMRKFLSRLHALNDTDRELSPEAKFHIATAGTFYYALFKAILKIKLNSWTVMDMRMRAIRFLMKRNAGYNTWSFGFGRQRPVDFSSKNLYFQHSSAEELKIFADMINAKAD